MTNLKKAGAVAALMLALLTFPRGVNADDPITVLYTFTGGDTDGEYPEGGLIHDGATLYGSTFGSLTGDAPGKHCPKGCGNLYSLADGGGPLTVVHSFSGGTGEGAFPTGEVLLQHNVYYGTTAYGTATNCGGFGCGTVYKIPVDGRPKFSRFCLLAACADGAFPRAGLTPGTGGNLFGTTTFGGVGNGLLCGSSLGGCGVVYRLASNVTHQAIYSFCTKVRKNVCMDGAVPLSGLIADDTGNLYGTTQFGGAHLGGTIFKLTPRGRETVLHAFCTDVTGDICVDGSVPKAGLIAYAGNLYGTATYGGMACPDSPSGCGVVFKIAPDGTGYRVLYSFKGGTSDGEFPQAPLVSDGAGILYGTTLRGGSGICNHNMANLGCGVLFQLAAAQEGPDLILHAFDGDADGAHPAGALVLLNGVIYGATTDDGISDTNCKCGTLYSFNLTTKRSTRLRKLH